MQYSKEIFDKFDVVYITGYVLRELEKHKQSNNEEKKYLSRRAVNDIEANENKVIYFVSENNYNLPSHLDKDIIDNKIIANFKEIYDKDNSVIFLSNDTLFKHNCNSLGISCQKFNGNKDSPDDIYKGYQTLSGGTYFINELFDNIENGVNDYNFVTNEFLILYNSDTDKLTEHRFDGNKFVDLKLPNSKVIKGLNSLQRCALDVLNNKDISIVAVNGEVGSGKSYGCVRMALHHVLDRGNASKVLAVREAIGEGKEVGFLKGTFEDKTKMFFKPIEQSLSGGEFELQSLIQRGILESIIPFYMKGTTYSNTIIVCDESEDLSKKQLKLVGTRLGDNSRIFFAGDYKQSVIDSSSNNALVCMCNELKGNKNFGCIYLDTDVRSDASKIFANLFVK